VRWLAFALLVGACQTAPSEPAQTAARCDVGDQSVELNRMIEQAARGGKLDAGLAARADAIANVAVQAGDGAASARDGAHQVACRATSLRAYSALLRVPERQAQALQGLRTQAIDGAAACGPLSNSSDSGVRMACDYIGLWRHTVATAQALADIRAVRTRLTRPATPTQPEQTPLNTVVPEEAWTEIGRGVESVRLDIGAWGNAPGHVEHKTRFACDFYGLMSGEVMHWRAVSNSEAKFQAVTQPYPGILLAAADALSIPGEGDARVLELERTCRRLAGS
jgi:hypothetical protein